MAEQWAAEDHLIEALSELIFKCDELNVDLVLIGAFAVRAYAERRRLTTDVDFVAPRSARNSLAAVLKSLGYEYTPRTGFGGVRAVKYVKAGKIQLDVDIDLVRDDNTGNEYRIPSDSFRSVKRELVSLSGDASVQAYAVPLVDLLVLKLMASRDQDAADAIALVLTQLRPDTIDGFKRKVRDAGLTHGINTRLGQIVTLSDRNLQDLMSDYTGGRLTMLEIRDIRRHMRLLRT